MKLLLALGVVALLVGWFFLYRGASERPEAQSRPVGTSVLSHGGPAPDRSASPAAGREGLKQKGEER
ncbi:MAG: hypothetical protein AB1411_08065 [Nitrospirota bacterium]